MLILSSDIALNYESHVKSFCVVCLLLSFSLVIVLAYIHIFILLTPFNSLPPGNFFILFCRLLIFFRINFFRKNSFWNTI